MTEELQQLKNTLSERRDVYKLLGSLYQLEVNAASLSALKTMHFPQTSDNERLSAGAEGLNRAIARLEPGDLDDLAADYARTFLSAGIADGPAAYPIESVYTSRQKLIMQDAYEEMTKILAQHGVAPAHKDLYPDHLGVEFEFMAVLIERTLKALDEDKTEAASALLDEQKAFLEKHLLGWTGKFFEDQRTVAGTDFYKALADFSEGWLQEDASWLSC